MHNGVLVSIIIRTKDRPALVCRALESVARQTWRPLEVVVVNDGGVPLEQHSLRQALGDVPLKFLPLTSNVGRAKAANLGIDKASGVLIAFLDDDDEFDPEHIELLIDTLVSHKAYVAYSGVRMVQVNGVGINAHRETVCVFSKPFSAEDLVIANYIPINGLLFDANLLRSLRFDESFDLYEDWDLLIRASEHADFAFTGKVTATYYQWSDTQVGFNSSPRQMEEATIRLYEKHRARLPLQKIYQMRNELDRLQKKIVEMERNLEKPKSQAEAKVGFWHRMLCKIVCHLQGNR